MSTVKGWCPGAYRPMMSGDGLIARIRPRLGQLTAEQVLGLCDISRSDGNGIIDLTSRANLQMRGMSDANHNRVLNRLADLDLLDADPVTEAKRNIVTHPLWQPGGLTERLHNDILANLPALPDLPAKMGMALDTGPMPMLGSASADFRFEQGADGSLILRADGSVRGWAVDADDAPRALIEMAHWFCATGGANAGRMAHHLLATALPEDWRTHPARPQTNPLQAGRLDHAQIFGAPFGSLKARALAALMTDTNATALRCTPWRLFLLEGAETVDKHHGFVSDPDDPILRAHACPGAPACTSATVETRKIARILAPRHPEGLHVSGCTKGCAHPRPARLTLVGNDGAYDLVEEGHPWDQPRQRGLSADDLTTIPD